MIKGIDTAKWQGDPPYIALKQAGIVFAVAKATHGLNSVDPKYMKCRAMMEVAFPEGRIGEYHWILPQQDAMRQADFMCKTIELATGGRGLRDADLPPTMDCEDDAGGTVRGQRLVDQIYTFGTRIEQNLGRRPILYSGKWFWDLAITPKGQNTDDSCLIRFPYWHSQYSRAYDVTKRILPKLYQKVGFEFDQYDGNGGELMPNHVDADFDYFNGDVDALDVFIRASHLTEQELPPTARP